MVAIYDGGVVVARTPVMPGPEKLSDQAYDRIRELIRDGGIPAGGKLTERGLAARLDVSAMPVREALQRLEREGLAVREGPKTLRVAVLDRVTSEEILEAEVALRGVIARFAARNIADDELARLYSLLSEADRLSQDLLGRAGGLVPDTDVRRVLILLREFNQVFERSCHNPVLLRLLENTRLFTSSEQVHATLERLRSGTLHWAERYRYHRELLGALGARDESTAERLTIRHAEEVRRDLLSGNLLLQNGSDGS